MDTLTSLVEFIATEVLMFIDVLYLTVFMILAQKLKTPVHTWISYAVYGYNKYQTGKRVSIHLVIALIGFIIGIPFFFSPGLQAIGTTPVRIIDNQVVRVDANSVELVRYGMDVYGMKLFLTFCVATTFYDNIIITVSTLWKTIWSKITGK